MVFGDLLKMDNMYQFSLASFIKLFNKALMTKPQAANTEGKWPCESPKEAGSPNISDEQKQ